MARHSKYRTLFILFINIFITFIARGATNTLYYYIIYNTFIFTLEKMKMQKKKKKSTYGNEGKI